LVARGVLIVVSAGNEGGPVGAPANCAGVAGIAGIRHIGTKVGFSSLGPQVALSAPGGNCVNPDGQACLFSLDTTSNSGQTTPSASNFTDQISRNIGTSFSAPIVSGIAGLMLATNGNLKGSQLIARLQEGAVPFPVSSDATIPNCRVPQGPADLQVSECNCTTAACGAGMANAARSVAAALRPIAAVAVPTTVVAGSNVSLNASGSAAACNHTVSTYAWTTVSGTNPTEIVGANTANATVVAPATGQYTVRVTVTDETGKVDSADVIVSSTAATTSAPESAGTNACLTTISYTAPATAEDAPNNNGGNNNNNNNGGGGGGGGSLDLFALLGLAMLLAWGRARTRAYRPASFSAVSSQDF
jgi:serine protease